MTDAKEIWIAISDELNKAETKHPYWPENVIEQAAIVAEESGELIRAAIQYKYENGDKDECRKEAIQTAAMCIRFLKNLKPISPTKCATKKGGHCSNLSIRPPI